MAARKVPENADVQDEVRQRKKSKTTEGKNKAVSTPEKRQKKKLASPARSPKAILKKEQKRERRQERTKTKKVKKESLTLNVWRGKIRPWARRHWLLVTLMVCTSLMAFALYFSVDHLDHRKQDEKILPMVTDKVKLDISITNGSSGRLTIGLYGHDCPKTVMNFIQLATHEKGYGYKASRLHVIIPTQLIMGGDIVNNNGSSGRSALDVSFEDENLKLKHSVPGTVGMIPLKNNTDSKKSSQFYITFAPNAEFDGKSVVFGRVIEGMDFLRKLEMVPIDPKTYFPTTPVIITGADHEVSRRNTAF